METSKKFDNFPVITVVLTNLVSGFIYTSGFIITLRLGWIIALSYLAFILAFELGLLSRHCVNCYYWGKTCGFGKGRLSSLLFKKGDPLKFCDKALTWKDIIPDLLISLAPLITGIVLLIIKFDFLLLTFLTLLILLTTFGNGFIRGSLSCKFCKQRELGCPAEKLFSKADNK